MIPLKFLKKFLADKAPHYNNQGTNAYIIFLDASKAFNRVKMVKLISILIYRKVSLLIIRYLYAKYQ